MATTTAPRLSGMKFLVEKVIHFNDQTTVVLIGDQQNLGKHYAIKKVKRENPETDDIHIECAKASYNACQEQKLSQTLFVQYYDFVLKRKWLRVSEAEVLMEYVNGKSLVDTGRLTIAQYVLVFEQLASAMAILHRRKVLHGDLKTSNVMITNAGQVKLLNYGLAPVQAKFPKQEVGSREFAAPEKINKKAINELTDIYAFGATMYHALTGKVANTGTRYEGQGGAITIPAKLNPDIPIKLNNVIVTCLQSQADHRPKSMYDIHQQLEEMVKSMNLKPGQLKGAIPSNQE